jgi:flagellar motility protein MotE (MotC chaperone)
MRPKRSWFLPFLCAVIFAAAVESVLAVGDEAEKKADTPAADKNGFVEVHPADTAPPAEAAPGVPSNHANVTTSACLVDASAAEDLQRRRTELDAREKELKAHEAELQARERALEEELKKIAAVREDVEKIESARNRESSEKVSKLVETFETMSPKAASAVMATLDESLAVATMSRISTPKLAKIMNAMEPRKSARLSELLAGVVRARSAISASTGAAVATTQSAKGGDNRNGQNFKHDSTIGERTAEGKREPARGQ